MQRSFKQRLADLERLEPSHAGAGQLYEAACWGGLPEDEWFTIDGAMVSDVVWHMEAATVPRFVVRIDDDDAAIPPERPLRVFWV